MADAGYFRGTSADQDNRFSDKEKKLLKTMKFEDVLAKKIDMNKVKVDVLKPWITKRTTEMLKMEDDVVVEFIFNQLEEKEPDPRKMQINLTGFLNGKYARMFMGELWTMLDSAQNNENGIPAELVNLKTDKMKERKGEDARMTERLRKLADSMGAEAERECQKERGNRRERSSEREPMQCCNVEMLQHCNKIERQMTSLTSCLKQISTKVQEFQNETSLSNRLEQLSTKVEELQNENHQLKQVVNDLQSRNSLPEEKILANSQGGTISHSKPDNVAITKENMLELLTSCESFQKDLEKVNERQNKFDDMLSHLFQ